MTRPRSPTLLSLIVLGFVLVALPLVASLMLAVAQVNRLARESRADMLALQEQTATSRTLVERATSMERSSRQFLALAEPAYRALYAEHRDAVLALLDRLAGRRAGLELVAAVGKARASVAGLDELIAAGSRAGAAAGLDAAVSSLRDDVQAIVRLQNAQSREMAGAFPDKARRAQRTLIGLAMLVIPVSAGLAVVFFLFLAPPLRQMGRSIRALGRGALGEPIRVGGSRDMQQLGRHLEWLRGRLVELEAQKAQFLRNVSHELKTPLANIREGAELLVDDPALTERDETVQVARIVRENSVRLQQMIETLLRYGAEGDLTVGRPDEEIRFDQLVLEAIERQAIGAAGRSVTIDTELDAVSLNGNPKRLQVIVENLLSNALKFTPRGGRVQVWLRRGPEAVELDVVDSGPGIPECDREHIFEWFYTGHRPPDSTVAGTGMGLAIAREYAVQHGGNIALLPSTEGAHFRLTIQTHRP